MTKLILWRKFFHRQKSGRGHGGQGPQGLFRFSTSSNLWAGPPRPAPLSLLRLVYLSQTFLLETRQPHLPHLPPKGSRPALLWLKADSPCEVYCAELSFDALFEQKGALPVYKPLPRFPSVTRDIALICDIKIPVGDLEECIIRSGGEYLKNCELFDVYTGHHIAEGRKSVAFSLTMRSDDHTLTDDDAEKTVAAVLKALDSEFGAVIR